MKLLDRSNFVVNKTIHHGVSVNYDIYQNVELISINAARRAIARVPDGGLRTAPATQATAACKMPPDGAILT
ncbi:hypothetical protein [uncultured Roseicyclus sp.]|jgi:hypothetical protein|uniref:hypothetical protein n=1 Tax=uncultured Roseicyclus sp. TaxID=543072 RepID=UPI002634E010|nr:hypothetical protein [uncultured Roseicyclus sp.]